MFLAGYLNSSAVSLSSPLFDKLTKTVQVTPETAAGSKIATLRILMNEMTLSDISTVILTVFYGGVFHNNSGRSLHYWPSNQPRFKVVLSNISSNPTSYSSFSVHLNSTAVAELRELSPVYCTVNCQNYIAISLDLYLLSDSLYHLGEHPIVFLGVFISNNTYYYTESTLYMRVKAGMSTYKNFLLFIVISTHS